VRQLKNVVDQISIIERCRDITPEILDHYLPKNEQYTGLVAVEHTQQGSFTDSKNIEMLKQIVVSLSKELETLKQQVAQMNAERQLDVRPSILKNKEHQAGNIVDVATETEIEEATLVDSSPHPIKTKDDRVREAIQEALEASGGNRKVAASMLGMSERTLYRKLKEGL
jgi:DNA-binding NtrC family response regulator